MRRDMDLVRLVMLDIEGETEVDLSGYDESQINYHKKLLFDAGFINGVDVPTLTGWNVLDAELTWAGHDFLDDARNEEVWQTSMKRIGKDLGSASLDVVKSVLAAVATQFITGRMS